MGCITLLSDFGLQDASIASAKGILMQHAPGMDIIDISHLIEPFHLQQAAYITTAAFRNFPPGTCHVLLFDIYSQKNPRLVLCQKEGHYFLAPDNGILALAFNSAIDGVWNCFDLVRGKTFRNWLSAVGETIRNLNGKQPSDLNLKPCTLNNAPQSWTPKVDGNAVECHVIHVDRFGNVVININREQFTEFGNGRTFRIQFVGNEEITEISEYYSDVRDGEKLCRFNAAGFLEIAINRGDASGLFGLRLRRELHVVYNTIKIFFQ
jgi:S-adenosylmethionine hydrolase